MLIGVISDTHNDILGIKKAIDFFNLRKTELVLHCGDIFSPSAAKEFGKLNCGFKAVFGNNDIEQAALENIISNFGVIKTAPFEFKVDNKSFIMMHKLNLFSNLEKYDYILYGHTHKPNIEQNKSTIVLNPGEACGQRYARRTIALTDTTVQHAEIFDLDLEA